ncbi:hypothetical protein E2C01_039203 [Portunus trituberculatus]|uniref:Uncharacterized protein n=1 Tax=Portunus trituberculatus TaxID=210409 RepID=A0A5B7FM49_PORTR|nr:hypothetical protein [Portunus trituberculatus]
MPVSSRGRQTQRRVMTATTCQGSKSFGDYEFTLPTAMTAAGVNRGAVYQYYHNRHYHHYSYSSSSSSSSIS